MKDKLLYPIAGAVLAASSLVSTVMAGPNGSDRSSSTNAHDFSFQSIEGDTLPLSSFAGKAILIVNTASLCGFTPQYEELQTLWTDLKESGLIVLGVPSNDFGNQEPGTSEEIVSFCQGAYGVTFPLTEKVKIKGENAHPFYRWAREALGPAKIPRWNFHKYLVAPDGGLVKAYNSSVRPSSARLRGDINDLMESP